METVIKKKYPYLGTVTETEGFSVSSFAHSSPWKNANTSFYWMNFEYPFYHGHTDWEILITLNDRMIQRINGTETVLSTVNKILTFGNEDNFTALDIGVIDLFSGLADFIKIGSPFSFIITSSSVKIIEGNSLPLGILDEMNPTTCRTNLSSGDVIVFVSDGISDAFSSSSDLISFLSNERALNPKTLADNILEKALSLSDGKANDDMTVFCIRLFLKN